jgi:hypothetical protein
LSQRLQGLFFVEQSNEHASVETRQEIAEGVGHFALQFHGHECADGIRLGRIEVFAVDASRAHAVFRQSEEHGRIAEQGKPPAVVFIELGQRVFAVFQDVADRPVLAVFDALKNHRLHGIGQFVVPVNVTRRAPW